MTIGALRYENLSWRLDIEVTKLRSLYSFFNCLHQLARRNVHVMTAPKFQLRIDMSGSESSGNEASSSVHIEADYGNMKKLQRELQAAVDEASSTHAQRISRYIT